MDPVAPRVYPIIRYDDALAAIDFLVDAFGFTRGELAQDDTGRVVHAQLGYDTGVIMLSGRDGKPSPFDHGTTAIYVAVDDPDEHHDRAVKAGAKVIMDLVTQDYGSREYAAEDPEGNVWCFGTYRPAAAS